MGEKCEQIKLSEAKADQTRPSPVLYGRGGAHRVAMGGEGLYRRVSKTLTSQAFGLGPSSPAKSGRR